MYEIPRQTPQSYQFTFKKMKGMKVLTGYGYQWEEEKDIRKGQISSNMVDTFCIMYEDRKMKPIEVVLRRGKG
jgi:hypothetical protein